ncbi:MAG: uncharacterized protein JWO94_2069 [Verrucomicrobiaceae bacterium]|nr:uncharacterized protein [Verrucomicrobiaceae bacterium]
MRDLRRVVVVCLLLAGNLHAQTADSTPVPPPSLPEVSCGPDVVLVGDAWENVQVEKEEIRRLFQEGDLVRWPQKMAALIAHLRFMERKAVMVFGGQRQKLARAVLAVADRQRTTNELALAGNIEGLREEWQEMQAPLRVIGSVFPDEALIPATSLAHLLPSVPASVEIRLADPALALHAGKEAHVVFRMNTFRRGDLVEKDLLVAHEAKVHALIADLNLSDYHHQHPQLTGQPGEWAFDFVPAGAGPYRLWLDVVPAETGREEFPVVDLGARLQGMVVPESERTPALRSVVDGLIGELDLGGEPLLQTGMLAAARLKLSHAADGSPVANLEPVMGAFAHIVGIADDFATILHVHPHGLVPEDAVLGGPEIDFRFRPATPGFYRLFVQVRTGGATHCLAFGVQVAPRYAVGNSGGSGGSVPVKAGVEGR